MLDFQPITVIEKIAMLFLVLLCGLYAARRGFFTEKTPRALSLFLVNVTQPALIVASFDMEYSEEKLSTGLFIVAASVVIHAVAIVLARFFFCKTHDPDQNRVYRYALIFCNCSFLGFPVLDAIFGKGVGVFYGTFYCIVFNVLNFTYGIHLLRRGRGEKPKWYRAILNPGVLSTAIGVALYLLRLRLSDLPGESFDVVGRVLFSTISMVGDLTFPLSMVIVGALIASMKPKELFLRPSLYLFCLVKNLGMPLLTLGGCLLLGVRGEIGLLCVTMSAVPTAASCAIFAETYQSDSAHAARLVGLATLCSVVTLPCMVLLANAALC
ncbi:MAG: AEC family transporter [Clostridia bacterium]|nr:AEC family transporter [Clostridia bacterium]